MKIALVHDHLNQNGGAEKVLLALHEIFPRAPVYTITYDKEETKGIFDDIDVRTSFIQKLPFGIKKYKWFLPLMPAAFEQFDLSKYDIVISDSYAYSKGVITKPETLHVCFCHTPTRYLWNDHFEYIRALRGPKVTKKLVQVFTTYLRVWDKMAADRVNKFIANSEYISRRIKKYYQCDSDVIYPPVETKKFYRSQPEDFYLILSRLRPYKKVDLAIEVFNDLGLPLKIIGTGEEYAKLKAISKPNIEFLGYVSEEEKAKYLSTCKAFVHPQEEDFGITTVEAMAAGRPVIALGRGGALESVIDNKTGIFFYDQTKEALKNAIESFDSSKFNPLEIQQYASQFDVDVFKNKMKKYIEENWEKHKQEYTAK